MKKSVKQIAVLALSAVLLVGGSVAGTMAYLTSTATVKNTFTVGKVGIDLTEAEVDANGDATNIRTNVGNEYHLLPGLTYDKDPMVTVNAGSDACYVRMLVTVNNSSALDAILPNADLTKLFGGYDASTWVYKGNVEDATLNTRTYEFWYATEGDATVVPATANNLDLPALFTTIQVPSTVTNAQLASLAGFEINIVAHAIQSAGFANAEAAWAAFNS